MSTGAVKMLQPGDLVWDYSSERPSDSTLRDAGVKGASRYLTVVNSLTIPKMVTHDEVHHLADLGIVTMLNFEWNPGDPLKGTARGVSNALVTNSYRHESGPWGRALDWPDEVPVVVSLDVGVTTAELEGPVTDYFWAFADTYTGPIIGSYHGIFLHRRLQSLGISNGPFWTAGGAWSWSGSPSAVDDPPTQIVQRVSGVGGHNDLLAPVPFWDPNGDPPPPTEETMLLYNTEVYPQFEEAAAAGYTPPPGGWPVGWLWWVRVESGGKRWLHGEEFNAYYDALPATPVDAFGAKATGTLGRTTGQLQSIPDYKPPVVPAPQITEADKADIAVKVRAILAAKPLVVAGSAG